MTEEFKQPEITNKYWTLWVTLKQFQYDWKDNNMEQDAINAIINDESVVFANTEDDAVVRKLATAAYQVAAEQGYLDDFLAECEDLAQKFQAYMKHSAVVLATPKQALITFVEALAELIDSDIHEAIKLVAIAVYVTNNKDDFGAA